MVARILFDLSGDTLARRYATHRVVWYGMVVDMMKADPAMDGGP